VPVSDCQNRPQSEPMKTLIAVIVGIVTCGILAGFYVWSIHHRFYILSSSQGVAYELDRKTGETWTLYKGKKMRHRGDVAKESAETIPPLEASKITGNAGFSGFGFFSGKLYNGSEWTITKVVFTVTAKEDGGAIRWTRDLVDNTEVAPLMTESFAVSVTGDQGVKEMSRLGIRTKRKISFHGQQRLCGSMQDEKFINSGSRSRVAVLRRM